MQRTARKIREFSFAWEKDQYEAKDMSVLSNHITKSGIKDIAFQKNQDAVIYCVLNDGTVAAFTRETYQNVIAWSKLTTDGTIRSVCAIARTTGDDDVYMIVERNINGTTKRYVEYLEQYYDGNLTKSVFLDSCLTYDGYDATAGKTLTFGALTGSTTATSSSAAFSSGQVGRYIKIIGDDHAIVGKAKITAYTSSTVVTVSMVVSPTTLAHTGGTWGVGVLTISGLDHLNGEEVYYLADGSYKNTSKTVGSGSITLPNDAVYVTVGKAYESVCTTVPLADGSQLGTALSKKSRAPFVGLLVNNTQGISVGDGGSQYEVFQRSATTALGDPEPLKTGSFRTATGNEWEEVCQTTIKQSKPLPANILAVVQYTDTEEL